MYTNGWAGGYACRNRGQRRIQPGLTVRISRLSISNLSGILLGAPAVPRVSDLASEGEACRDGGARERLDPPLTAAHCWAAGTNAGRPPLPR